MKYTVITGASSGIGYESALLFAKRGKNLVVAARRETELAQLKTEIAKINPNVEVLIKIVDLTVAENVYNFYADLKDLELETWINNAGFGNFDSISEQKLSKIESMLHLNIEALTILSSLFVRDYANVDGTQLINVSSGGGYAIVPNAITYCATKFYVSAFTEGLSHELKATNAKMQAKVLAPAATETEFAKRARDEETFDYKDSVAKYHTGKEMAGFLLDLYDSNKVLGIVDPANYEFLLMDPQFNYATRAQTSK
ncbi:SDR family NAD(P)-dependent oxidoreductase [Listeria rocourtiae]|uniref:SDR family NAD(P)-dependent oxidoreductase n=1 Tax=Listeria rocourtiae TaxID=647910 RepID=UPI003D2F8D47